MPWSTGRLRGLIGGLTTHPPVLKAGGGSSGILGDLNKSIPVLKAGPMAPPVTDLQRMPKKGSGDFMMAALRNR